MYEQPYNPYAENLSVVKEYFKSSRVLVMGILYLVSLLVSIGSSIYTMAHPNAIIDYVLQLLNRLDPQLYSSVREQMPQLLESVESGSNISTILSIAMSVIITGLFVAAYFLIFTKSRNSSEVATPQAGVSILHVFAVLTLILTIIGIIGGVLAVVALFALGNAILNDAQVPDMVPLGDNTYINVSQFLTVVTVSLAVVVVIATIIALIYTINRVRYYSSVKKSLTTVDLENGGAKGYGVMCIIFGVFSAFGTLGTMISIFSITGDYRVNVILSFVANLVMTLILFIEGSLALGYRKHIDNYKYGYNSAPYGQYQDPSYVPAMPDADPYGVSGQDGYAGYNVPPQQDPYNGSYSDYGNNYVDPAVQDNYVQYDDSAAPAAPAVCPNCGAEVGNHPFCSKCGTKL